MSVSLCMIVKNEEENLVRCLDSIEGLVGEIILVDTGSTDRTVPIARHYGAKVFRRPWSGSFSEARNFALSKATGTWILIMDADDELEPGDRGALLELVRDPDGASEVYCGRTLSYSGDRADCSNILVTMTVRLIRNGRGYFYRGRVHEQLTGAGGPPGMTATEIRFYHYGYLSSEIEKKEKHRRNIELIRRELEDDPENGFMQFNLGNEYLTVGKAEEAMDCYRDSYRTLEPSLGYGSMLLTRMILCCEQLGRTGEQCRYIQEGLALYPELPDFEYLRASMFQRHGKLLKAIRSYRKCVRMGPPPPDGNSVLGVSTFKPHDRLAALYERLGERKLALRHCREAIRCNPNDREAFSRMINLLQEEGCGPDRLESRLLRMAEKDVCPMLILSDLFYDRRMFRQAMQFSIRAKRLAPECPAACYGEGICRFFLGQYRRAFRCLEAAPCRRTSGAAFFRQLCVLLGPAELRRNTGKFGPELERPDCLVAAAFRPLLKGEPCAPLPAGEEVSQEYLDSLFGLLEILLRAGLLNEFLKALELLKPIRGDGILLRLGKLYCKYGYAKLASHELERAICAGDQVDAEGFSILSRIRAAEAGQGRGRSGAATRD
ncbi:glycosyltransferase [Caproiciproducens sp. NJN-50]|uniref:tetratricopeptide repeat-containing glycosyltransferase family 2 protein n=1 Tax=Acutalibacteraceae TaxID=3082771 RepID=UPI000FFE3266|nr:MULTISPECIES: glycosyltransferase [Acutalibacteraceae]QAT50487.1 glycosyltransferase [Caproiciproducens sp. NJN-50]